MYNTVGVSHALAVNQDGWYVLRAHRRCAVGRPYESVY